jgi:hypothetical protein
MKFEQGIWYSFLIVGVANILDKGEHFILLHESGRKMLLKVEYYVKYNFSIGQNIECRVDKVNCTGQVFLEPKHPYYIENQVFSFELLNTFIDEESFYNTTVKDVFGNCIDVFINQIEYLQTNKSILLRVSKVKKGVPILSDVQKEKLEAIALNDNREIKLVVRGIKNFNSESYYILSDRTGIKAKLKVKHYQKYGFKIGAEIQCEIIGSNTEGQMLVEPINPWYSIGNAYRFKRVGLETNMDLEGNSVKILVLLDAAGNKCGVKIGGDTIEKKVNDEVVCKVIGFRKGRPLLEIDQ